MSVFIYEMMAKESSQNDNKDEIKYIPEISRFHRVATIQSSTNPGLCSEHQVVSPFLKAPSRNYVILN